MYDTLKKLKNFKKFEILSFRIFRAGHCICREYHNPDEHEHFEDEEHIPDYTWVSTCKSRDGGELVKKM